MNPWRGHNNYYNQNGIWNERAFDRSNRLDNTPFPWQRHSHHQREQEEPEVPHWGYPAPITNVPENVPANDGYPWRLNKTYDTRPIIALHQEINDFYDYISPTTEEHDMRMYVIGNIADIIHELWPSAIVEVFGSMRTGLYLPRSDIDLVIMGAWKELPLRTLEEYFLERGVCDSDNIRVVDKATVPIIKLKERSFDVKLDISFNVDNGLHCVELIKKFKSKYPALGKLLLVLKHFLLERDLCEVFQGGISSYSLTLMVVSFLQLHARKYVNTSEANLGVLLIEFFELYGRKFNYTTTGIRTRKRGSYVIKPTQVKEQKTNQRSSILYIEDPLIRGKDIGRSSYEMLQIKAAFEYAYAALTEVMNTQHNGQFFNTQHSILGRILKVSNDDFGYREWVRSKFYTQLIN